MRVALVTPYPWDRPAEANDHLGTLATALAEAGDEVVVLCPALSPALLREGRRRLRALEQGDATALAPTGGRPLVVAIGLAPAAPATTLPVGIRAALRLALVRGRFDVVDVLDADRLGLAQAALRLSPAPVTRTAFRPRAAAQLERLARVGEAALATTPQVAATLLERGGGTAEVTGIAVDPARFAPAALVQPPVVVVEATAAMRGALRGLFAELETASAEIVLLRSGLGSVALPATPQAFRHRARAVRAQRPADRAAALRGAVALVAAPDGSALLAAEARACGVPVVAPAGSGAADLVATPDLVWPREQPEIAAAIVGRLLADEPRRARVAAAVREQAAAESPATVAARVAAVYRRVARPLPAGDAQAERILCDFHMHTAHSHDCASPVADVVHRALEVGLGAIAVTDHNSVDGGLEARAIAEREGLPIHIIPGSEIKTATGEVIGLYLEEDIPRGMPFADTVEAIRAAGALVYIPHPFDRMHAVCDPQLLHRLADQIDVVETYNARLYREQFNREAERYAEAHELLAGAGSDAHVLEGIGTGAIDLPRFDGPESLLLALGEGVVRRRPANLLYLQGLKWVRQARKR